MFLVLMGMAALVVAYTACARPNWFWAAFLCAPTLLTLMGATPDFNPNAIAVGPIKMRFWDPSILGLVVGILYHGRSQRLRSLRRQPVAIILILISSFLALKILIAALFGGAVIASNALTDNPGGPVVAATGEVRDSFLALVVPLYAVLSARHLNLFRMTVPFVVAIVVILLKCAVQVAGAGYVWSGKAEFRFLNADEAMTLTILGLVVLFLRSARRSRTGLRLIACVGFVVAVLGNHRSQWLGALLGLVVLLALAASGRLQSSRGKLARALSVMGIMIVLATGSALVLARSELQSFYESTGIESRLLAISDPGRDPTASWRLKLWEDRISQVGDDWLSGRQLGDRRQSLVGQSWVTVQDHNAYVTSFELGGLLLLGLVIAFWSAVTFEAVKLLRTNGLRVSSSPAALALVVTAASLGYAMAYDFPSCGPALATILTLRGCGQPLLIKGSAAYRALRWPSPRI